MNRATQIGIRISIAITLVSYLYILSAQTVILKNQADIDAFDPATHLINGSLIVGTLFDDISDLSNLSNLRIITENLRIQYGAVPNLNGLSNLDSIGGNIEIIDNPYLTSIDGLNDVIWIGGSITIEENQSLVSINSLQNITHLNGNLKIDSQYELIEIDGFSSLSSINGTLHICSNINLKHLDGLSNLEMVSGGVSICFNDLENFMGFPILKSVG